MMERDLFEQYRLNCNHFVNYRGYQAFYDEEGTLYIMVPVSQLEQDELLEIKQMADFLQYQQQELRIASFVATITQELTGIVNNESVLLFKMPPLYKKKNYKEGYQLALFHKKGGRFPYQPQIATRLRNWHTLWANRLDQLENWWEQRIKEAPINQMEKAFFETFPYYLGLAENAIQYIADCIWEDQRNETSLGTICHLKFTSELSTANVILPTDLIYDHPTRDLAEWIRFRAETGAPMNEVVQFLESYEKVIPITATNRRLLFGRLLFPLSYFEIIEGYFLTEKDEEKQLFEQKFFEYTKKADYYENYLREFFNSIGIGLHRGQQIPEIEWLQTVKN